MESLLLTFSDNATVGVFVHDVQKFTDVIDRAGTSLISNIKVTTPKQGDIEMMPEPQHIVECCMTLFDGNMLLVSILASDIPEVAERCSAVFSCEQVFTKEVSNLVLMEQVLDNRMEAVRSVVNNIPNKCRRLKLQKIYIQRKTAYIVALEAMLDGAYRD